jgi:hypothetical protein
MSYVISYLTLFLIDLLIQVERLVWLLKHKLRPENAFFKEHDFDAILSVPIAPQGRTASVFLLAFTVTTFFLQQRTRLKKF